MFHSSIILFAFASTGRTCGAIVLEHGTAECTEGDAFASACSLRCDDGYAAPTSDQQVVVTRCLADATWSHVLPICRPNACSQDQLDDVKVRTCFKCF